MCQCVRVHVGVGVRAPHAPSLWLPLSLHKYLSHFHVRACRVFAGAYKACAELEAELVDSAVVLTLQVFFLKKNWGGGGSGRVRFFLPQSGCTGLARWRRRWRRVGRVAALLFTRTPIPMRTRTYIHTHAHMRTCAQPNAHARTLAHTQAPKRAHACTRTRTTAI
jgi:hypothetical protein